jgi:hypothetical protein
MYSSSVLPMLSLAWIPEPFTSAGFAAPMSPIRRDHREGSDDDAESVHVNSMNGIVDEDDSRAFFLSSQTRIQSGSWRSNN